MGQPDVCGPPQVTGINDGLVFVALNFSVAFSAFFLLVPLAAVMMDWASSTVARGLGYCA